MRACQGWSSVFGTFVLAGVVSAAVFGVASGAKSVAAELLVEVEAWAPRPWPDVVLDTPELAACLLLAPAAWSTARPPAPSAPGAALGAAVTAQLGGGFALAAPARLTVVLAAAEGTVPTAVASGATVLLVVPGSAPWAVADAARIVVAALARAHTEVAPPDPRCSEPLLATAETLVVAGALTLATLPPELRPVADWLEHDDATTPLRSFVDAVLAEDEPWSSRRVRLQQTALTSGANAQLLTAAALLVEVYGDLSRARRAPYDLLLAWRDDRDRRFPPLPGALRRALAAPLRAGMPDTKRREDDAAIAARALARAVESASLTVATRLDGASLALRALAAAQARARGSGAACALLLSGPVATGLRTGCRSDESGGGFVVSRPRPQGGFEIVAVAGSDEVVLLRWPRWVLSPAVLPATGTLVLVDTEGVWAVPLDGGAAPRLLVAGAFRHLAPGPDGATLAAARWPDGTITVIAADGVRELGQGGRGGVAWLDGERLVGAAADGTTVVSLAGERRLLPLAIPCARALARAPGSLLVAAAAPCEAGIVSVALGEGSTKLALARGDAPATLVATGGETVLFADPAGVFRWRPGEAPVRVGGGLSPGPG